MSLLINREPPGYGYFVENPAFHFVWTLENRFYVVSHLDLSALRLN